MHVALADICRTSAPIVKGQSLLDVERQIGDETLFFSLSLLDVVTTYIVDYVKRNRVYEHRANESLDEYYGKERR